MGLLVAPKLAADTWERRQGQGGHPGAGWGGEQGHSRGASLESTSSRGKPRPHPMFLCVGTKAQAGTEDTLGHAPSPRWDPEPDRDDLYHPPPGEAEEAQEEAGLWSWALSPPQGLQGPEEDRDHIYHPREDSWGP